MATIEQARNEVHRHVQEALAIAEQRDGSAANVEEGIWRVLLGLGRALMLLSFARRSALPRRATYEHDGLAFEIVGRETTEVGTRFGKVEFERPVGRQVGDSRSARDLPLDRELGLPGGFTLPVVTTFAKLCAMMAFASARSLFRSMFGWSPSPRAVLRMVDASGQQARPFLEQAKAPEDDGEVLVIEVDGKGAPAISSKEYARRTGRRQQREANQRHDRRKKRRRHPRPRRAPGEKSKNAKMAAVGVLYTLRRDAQGKLEGPVNKRTYATFESYRALFEWLRAEAEKRGYGTGKFVKVLFIADGADVIWKLKQEFFPEALECLDWYHIVEKLWAVGKAIHRGTRRQRRALEAWVADQKKRLRKGQVVDVLDEIERALSSTPVTGPGNKYRREILASVLSHYVKNLPRMRYAHLRRQDLPISSGVIEGAVRHLVGVRLDGPGMRWGRDRAEAILHLRCVLINGQWSEFESFLANHPAFHLNAQPVPACVHDAKIKLAA